MTHGSSHNSRWTRTLWRGLLASVVGLTVLGGFWVAAQAAIDPGLQPVADTIILPQQDIRVLIANIIRGVLGVIGIVSIAIIAWAGWRWMSSGGDESKIEEAKKTMVNWGIGLLIILLAFAIVTFIINSILGQPLFSLFSLEQTSFGRSALGGGIIESHYPPRGAHCASPTSDQGCIPRNTPIIVTFKEPMDPTTLMTDIDPDVDVEELIANGGVLTGHLNSQLVRIYRESDGPDAMLEDDWVDVRTADLRTFVFKPNADHYLGSPDERMYYGVLLELSRGIEKLNGDSAGSEEYQWDFEVGTFLDLTPPRVEGVFPVAGSTEARNAVVQIVFNEPIDPTTASGQAVVENCVDADNDGRPESCDLRRFDNIVVARTADVTVDETTGLVTSETPLARPVPLAGRFTLANQYTTVEFTTNDICGVNSCGEEIYCLPQNSRLAVTIQSAELEHLPPSPTYPGAAIQGATYSGITDVVGNSLNGNGENGQQCSNFNCAGVALADDQVGDHCSCTIGPEADNYTWNFAVNDRIILGAASLLDIYPEVSQSRINLERSSTAFFSRIMMTSTLTSDRVSLRSDQDTTMPWWISAINRPLIVGTEQFPGTTVTVSHDDFQPSVGDSRFDYSTEFTSGIKDIYQNCFIPVESQELASGLAPSCHGEPSCCNAHPYDQTCPQPLPPLWTPDLAVPSGRDQQRIDDLSVIAAHLQDYAAVNGGHYPTASGDGGSCWAGWDMGHADVGTAGEWSILSDQTLPREQSGQFPSDGNRFDQTGRISDGCTYRYTRVVNPCSCQGTYAVLYADLETPIGAADGPRPACFDTNADGTPGCWYEDSASNYSPYLPGPQDTWDYVIFLREQ